MDVMIQREHKPPHPATRQCMHDDSLTIDILQDMHITDLKPMQDKHVTGLTNMGCHAWLLWTHSPTHDPEQAINIPPRGSHMGIPWAHAPQDKHKQGWAELVSQLKDLLKL